MGTNLKELHTPKSTPKKPEGDGGDMKKKLEFNMVLYENKAWQEANIMFWELSKQKSMFVGIIETSSIWHLLQCNLFDWDWTTQNKEEFAKSLGTFVRNPNFNIVSYCVFEKFLRGNKWYSITLTILIHCNTSYF